MTQDSHWRLGMPYTGMRRDDIYLYLGPASRAELQALISNRNTPCKLVWRAEIVLAAADGHGTFEIMRRAGELHLERSFYGRLSGMAA